MLCSKLLIADNEYILSNANFVLERQEAIVPLIWLIGAAVAACCCCISAGLYSSSTSKVKGTTLAVLGMQMAGKTLFYNQLRKIAFTADYVATGGMKDVDAFDLRLKNRTVRIEKCKDIGGGDDYVRPYYEKLLNEKDIAIFLFNVSSYINDKGQRDRINARIEFVHRHSTKSLALIGTHLDLFSKSERSGVLISQVQNMVKNKDYAIRFSNNFFVVDLRDIKSVLEIMEKIL